MQFNAPSRFLRPISVLVYYSLLSLLSLKTGPSLFLWYFSFLAEFIVITLAANVIHKLRKRDGDWFSGSGSIFAAITYLPIPALTVYFAISSVGEADSKESLFIQYAPQLILITFLLIAEYATVSYFEFKSNQVIDSVRQFIAYVLAVALLAVAGLALSFLFPAFSVWQIIGILGLLRILLEFILRRWLSKF